MTITQRSLPGLARRLTLAAALAAVLLMGGCNSDSDTPSAAITSSTDAVTYLSQLGWEVEAEPVEVLQLELPEDLAQEAKDYCKLQKQQGFSFPQCGGKEVTRYTFTLLNYPDEIEHVQVNLYICREQLIGGDVMALGANGFQRELAYPSEETAAAS